MYLPKLAVEKLCLKIPDLGIIHNALTNAGEKLPTFNYVGTGRVIDGPVNVSANGN